MIIIEIKEFKQYTKNLDCWTPEEIVEFEVMNDDELDWLQTQIEYDTGEQSGYDVARAIITLKHQIKQWEDYANLMKDDRDYWDGENSRSYGKYLTQRQEYIKLDEENFYLKKEIENLKYMESEYGKLILENAELINFKETVKKYLTDEQLKLINEELNDTSDGTYY